MKTHLVYTRFELLLAFALFHLYLSHHQRLAAVHFPHNSMYHGSRFCDFAVLERRVGSAYGVGAVKCSWKGRV